MRDLTAEELALAPEWAYYYDFFDDIVVYMSKGKNSCGDYKFFSKGWGVYFGNEDDFNLCTRLVPRKRKPFDITQHEWSDNAYGESTAYGNGKRLNVNDGVDNSLSFNKDDAIAIAKHFKLTKEDLK